MFISAEAHASLRRSEVRDGDILITITGNVGRVVYLSGVGAANLNQHIARIRIHCAEVDSRYIFQYLNQPKVRQYYNKITTGQAYPQISLLQVRETKIPLPLFQEQQAIADALCDTDALIASLDALIVKKRNLKQAAMEQLLSGEARLAGFKASWGTTTLGSISAFITKGATPTTYGFAWQSAGILFLRSECVSENGLDLSQSMFISPAAHEVLRRGEVRSGDLLVTITGNVGRVVILDQKFGIANINQHIARVRIKSDDVDPRYVYHYLSQPKIRRVYNSIVTGQAYPQISLKQVRETVIPLPEPAEQSAIADVLSDMNADISALESRRSKAGDLRRGMMQELLTGRIRLI